MPLYYTTVKEVSGTQADRAAPDISSRGLWSTFERTFYDVRILHPNSPSYLSKTSGLSIANIFYIEHEKPNSSILATFHWRENARVRTDTNSIFVKGPKLYNLILSQLETMADTNCNTPIYSSQMKPFKNYIKSHILKLQAFGEADEWTDLNYGLYKGNRRSTRVAQQSNLMEAFFS